MDPELAHMLRHLTPDVFLEKLVSDARALDAWLSTTQKWKPASGIPERYRVGGLFVVNAEGTSECPHRTPRGGWHAGGFGRCMIAGCAHRADPLGRRLHRAHVRFAIGDTRVNYLLLTCPWHNVASSAKRTPLRLDLEIAHVFYQPECTCGRYPEVSDRTTSKSHGERFTPACL